MVFRRGTKTGKARGRGLAFTGRLALAVFVLSAPLLAADSPSDIAGIYTGAIGRQQIVLEMGLAPRDYHNRSDGSASDRQTYPIEGRYFYRRHGITIHLVGTPLPDGKLRLREYQRPGGFTAAFGAEWRLTTQGDRATGIFCRCDLGHQPSHTASVLKIHLKRVSHEFHQEFQPDPVYDRMLLDFPLKNGPEIQVNREIAYTMLTDPRFTVARPQLTHFPDSRVMAKFNTEMATQLNWDRRKAAECLAGGQLEAASGGFYDERTTVAAFPPNSLSILIGRSWYCDAEPHPNESIYTLNYNLHTGERFTLENSFRTAEGSTAEADIAALLASLYRRHYIKPPRIVAPEDCDVIVRRHTSGRENLTDAFSPRHSTLFMSKAGLMIIPTFFPRPDSGCGPPVTVPYGELRPFVNKHSMLYLAVDGRNKR